MQQVRKSAAGVKRRKWSPADRAEYIEILGEHANCPLSPAEIIDWARKLGRPGSDCERELRELLTIAFWNASSSLPARKPFEDEVRVDKRLPEIAKRLGSIHRDLLSLPSDVDAALRVRSGFGEYDKALDNLRALRRMLDELADLWSRPYRGNPSLKPASVAIEMLVLAVEEFTGKRLPAPRTSNLHPDLQLVRSLAEKLTRPFTGAQVNTMLQHIHNRRREKGCGNLPRPRETQSKFV